MNNQQLDITKITDAELITLSSQFSKHFTDSLTSLMVVNNEITRREQLIKLPKLKRVEFDPAKMEAIVSGSVSGSTARPPENITFPKVRKETI